MEAICFFQGSSSSLNGRASDQLIGRHGFRMFQKHGSDEVLSEVVLERDKKVGGSGIIED